MHVAVQWFDRRLITAFLKKRREMIASKKESVCFQFAEIWCYDCLTCGLFTAPGAASSIFDAFCFCKNATHCFGINCTKWQFFGMSD